MISGLRIAVVVMAVTAATAQNPATSGLTTVSGIVRDAQSRRPIHGARVVLVPAQAGPRPATTTSEDGVFVFHDVKPGAYFVTAHRSPYAKGVVPEPKAQEPERPLRVDSRGVTGIEILLVPGAVITGRVLDPFGQPAVDAGVGLRRLGPPTRSRFSDSSAWMSGTDDSGQYRLFGLPAGDYLVVAHQNMYADIRLGATNGSLISIAPVYFPNAGDPGQAHTVTVTPGEERTGVDMRLRLATLHTVSGSVAELADVSSGNTYVQISPMRSDLSELGVSLYAEQKPPDFIVRRVPPGQYWVTARGSSSMEPTDPDTARAAMRHYWAAAEVTVGDADVTGVSLNFQPASKLSGRVVVRPADGGSPAATADRVQVWLEPLPGVPRIFFSAGARTDTTGMFSIAPAVRGRHRLVVRTIDTMEDLTVDSVTVNGVISAGSAIDVPAGELKDVLVAVAVR